MRRSATSSTTAGWSIYKTNISEPGPAGAGQRSLGARRPGGSGRLEVREHGDGDGRTDLGGWSWGAQFGDLNNDGAQDLYLVNGYISAGERSSYWYDFSVIAVGHSSIIGDAANWPAMKGRSLSGYQRKRVWINDGFGNFTDVAQAVGATDTNDGRAVALADLRNTGVLDIIVANQRGPLSDLREPASRRTGTGSSSSSRGPTSNRSAIGARVELHWNGHVQAQEVSAATGFSAQNQRPLHYGLGQARIVDRVVIRWPSGATHRPLPIRRWTCGIT